MTLLIAEDLLLLMLDDTTGAAVGAPHLRPALGGAVLVELALAGVVRVEERTSVWRSAKVRPVTGAPPVEDPLLQGALAIIAERDRSAQDLVNRLGKDVKDHLTGRLVERGILHRQEDRVLGLFPRTRWPAIDSSHERAVRQALTAVLVQGTPPDDRTGALVALLSAVDRAHRVVEHRGMSSWEVRKRAKAIARGDWAADAVKSAIASSNAAVTAAVAASTSAAVISS